MSYIEVRNLKKYFETPSGTLHAVDDVSFTIEKGETLGIVGESGCGKSTLGKTIIRLHDPTSGEVIFDGEDISSMSPQKFHHYRKRIQMIFQDPSASLDRRMSVKQLIEEPLKIFKIGRNSAEREHKVQELMDTVGIAKRYQNSYPHELDGGRRQRVVIARALSLDSEFIICDEPVSALDVSIQAQVLNLLQTLQREKILTYMFITHDLSVVRHISDNICVMYLGQVVEKSESKELFKKTLHPYSKALLSAIPRPTIHNRQERILLKGELTSPIDPPEHCRFAPRCQYATEECFHKCPSLEEVWKGHFVSCLKAHEINQDIINK